MSQPQTDAQAALAAAALVMGGFLRSSSSPRLTALQAREWTTTMADDFMAWLRRPGAMTVVRRPASADERLVPNEDFRSPSAAATERFDPGAIARAARVRAHGHVLDPFNTTPSGARACYCGDKWPCSQSAQGDRFSSIDKLATWATERTELHGGAMMAARFASEGIKVFRTDGRYELVAEARTAAYAQLIRDGLNMISDECAPYQRLMEPVVDVSYELVAIEP